ncbi:hypothetical protein EV702DRAFT_1051056 [Suillus placidus]|uniref:Uncharacterized protein n=1 Tax=Suillus placidus TaxID=48579 RepID=A0A9P6ZHN0_9AGAM|nr:hypothetical protein EV702DRAFT_1051056 [Suillus placidus]
MLLHPRTTVGDPVIQDDRGHTVVPMKSLGGNCHKRSIQYSLFQSGVRDEDSDLPTKRLKTLQTTWNYTPRPSSEATNYLNERMLELSRITRRTIAARIRYQCLRSCELDLIKSIVEDEKELTETQLKGIDLQIGSIRNMLQDGGVTAIASALKSTKSRAGTLVTPKTGVTNLRVMIVDNINEQYSGDHYHYRAMINELTVTLSPSLVKDIILNLTVYKKASAIARILDLRPLSPPFTFPSFFESKLAMVFQTFQYDPNDPSSCTRRRLATHPATAGLSRRIYPYNWNANSRGSQSTSLASASLISLDDTESIRCLADTGVRHVQPNIKDFSPTEQSTLAWAQRRMIINSVTTTGWLRNITSQEKKAMSGYITEIINQANLKFNCNIQAMPWAIEYILKEVTLNRRRLAKLSEAFTGSYDLEPPDPNVSTEECQTFKENRRDTIFNSRTPFSYYLHGQELTDISLFLLFFANPAVSELHIRHWYGSKHTPLHDEDMRSEIQTTPTQMLAQSATSLRCAVDRVVLGRTSNTGNPIHFTTSQYAHHQEIINLAMLQVLMSPIHPPFQGCLLDLHNRGLLVLRAAKGLDPPVQAISNPVTAEQAIIILEIQQQHSLHVQDSHLQVPEQHESEIVDYSVVIYIPLCLEEITLLRSNTVPPLTVSLHLSMTASTSTDPIASADAHIPDDFGQDFLQFSQGYTDEHEGSSSISGTSAYEFDLMLDDCRVLDD